VIGRWGWEGFAAAVRRELGATRWYSAIARAVFDAATAWDPTIAAGLDRTDQEATAA
jgi:hypothetical protein